MADIGRVLAAVRAVLSVSDGMTSTRNAPVVVHGLTAATLVTAGQGYAFAVGSTL